MKTLKQWFMPLIFITIVPTVLATEEDIRDHPGYVDFTSLTAIANTEPTVEVSLKTPLLNLITNLMRNSDEEAAEFISKLRRVTVNVFETDAIDVDEIAESMTVIAAALDADGWERVIRVRDSEDHVDVHFRLSDNAEIIYGITIMVAEPGDTVLVNIAGEISANAKQVSAAVALGRRFDIDELVDIDLNPDRDADLDGDQD